MFTAHPAAGSPRSQTAFTTADLEEARAYLTKVFVPHNLLGHGPIAFSHRRLDFASCSLNFVRYGGDVEIVAPPMGDFYLLQLGISGTCSIVNGGRELPARADQLYAINATKSLQMKWSADCDQIALKIPRFVMERELIAALQQPLSEPLEFLGHTVDSGRGAPAALLASMLIELGSALDLGSAGYSGRALRATESALMALLLETLPHNYSERLSGARNVAVPRQVMRAEAFMREHIERTIGIDEIAAASGVSQRSLYYAFRQFRAMTPMAALRQIRLDRAHKMLAQSGCSVTEAALAAGFRHLGKFSRDFRRRYGVNPSEFARQMREPRRG